MNDDNWIKCSDNLPSIGVAVIFYTFHFDIVGGVFFGYRNDDNNYISVAHTLKVIPSEHVTHWMYLPRPPKED